MSQHVPGDESFSSWLRALVGAKVELELVTGRIITGRLGGVHPEWVMMFDDEKKQNVAPVVHVASVRVLEPKRR